MQVLLQALQGETPKQAKTPIPEVVGDAEDASDFALLFAEDVLEVSVDADGAALPTVTPEEQSLSDEFLASAAEPAQPAIEVVEPVVAPISPIAPKLAERDLTQTTQKTPSGPELATDDVF